jgi:hypothetical protein
MPITSEGETQTAHSLRQAVRHARTVVIRPGYHYSTSEQKRAKSRRMQPTLGNPRAPEARRYAL